ncbi:hypothetical protein [Streptomyces gibsoniae]|uniref:Uncharacterized protein n=1 Tax=Streptomyces gibsoniae TaxID=3075529 RepID=A0ABU2U5H8_9ACTN|nr:hypothetical protein [Streptomyces sp. DSM 41699]MDT0468479.1 hypothetical protein [Streptomyces sp. DSM 41699]
MGGGGHDAPEVVCDGCGVGAGGFVAAGAGAAVWVAGGTAGVVRCFGTVACGAEWTARAEVLDGAAECDAVLAAAGALDVGAGVGVDGRVVLLSAGEDFPGRALAYPAASATEPAAAAAATQRVVLPTRRRLRSRRRTAPADVGWSGWDMVPPRPSVCRREVLGT